MLYHNAMLLKTLKVKIILELVVIVFDGKAPSFMVKNCDFHRKSNVPFVTHGECSSCGKDAVSENEFCRSADPGLPKFDSGRAADFFSNLQL